MITTVSCCLKKERSPVLSNLQASGAAKKDNQRNGHTVSNLLPIEFEIAS